MGLIAEHRGPLSADFRRFYDCTLTDALAGREGPLSDVAAWAAHLPPDSATRRSIDPHWQRTALIDLMREAEFDLRILAWQQTEDGSKGRNVPERIPLPWDEAPEQLYLSDRMTLDEIDAWLGWDQLKEA